MKIFRFTLGLFFTLVATVTFAQSFEAKVDGFYKDGKWYRVISGSLDYSKIAKDGWKDRLDKAKALGLNTITTNVFWNHHETVEGFFDFTTENRDLVQFLKLAKETGLSVILKAGPYINSTWEMGGLPAWLLQEDKVEFKTDNLVFMAYITRYINTLFSQIKDLQYANGGPIIMFELSDYDSSFGDETEFLTSIYYMYKDAGAVVPIFSNNNKFVAAFNKTGDTNLVGANTFSKKARKNFKLATNNEGSRYFASDFQVLPPTYLSQNKYTKLNIKQSKRDLRWMLRHKKSFNINPISASSKFGTSAGAIIKEEKFYPATIVDGHNALIKEDGTLTKEYKEIRRILSRYQNSEELPLRPMPNEDNQKGKGHTIYLKKNATLAEALVLAPLVSLETKTMEECGFNYNLIGYKTTLANKKRGTLTIDQPRDIAYIYLNGEYLGSMHRNKKHNRFKIPKVHGSNENELVIIIENLGRVSSGKEMSEKKGITNEVRFNGVKLLDWEIYPIPMNADFLETLPYAPNLIYMEPVIHTATFELKQLGDIYLDVLKWTSGIIVVNGHNLGRYQNHSVQNKIYCPKEFLNDGENVIYILDMGMEHLPSIFIKTKD